MVSKRKAKKAVERIKQHWKRVLTRPVQQVSNGFMLPCQEMPPSEAERMAEELAGMVQPEKSRPRAVHPALVWLLRIGGSTLLFGGLGMIRPQFFPLAVFFVYLGLAVLALDLYVESGLLTVFKIFGWVVISATAIWFSIAVVFVPAPVSIFTLTTPFNYPENKGPANIDWRPYYAELDVLISNPTDGNYDDINVLVRPDAPVAAVAQLSNLLDVSFEDQFGMTTHFTIEDVSQPDKQLTMVFLATDAGYKVHCGRIPPYTSLKIVMAVVSIDPGRERKPNEPFMLSPNVKLEEFYVTSTVTNKNGKFFYWYGNENNSSLYLPKSQPTKISVVGSYVAANRVKKVNQEIPVKGWPH